jgi:predicted TIM-barrel fold metal-dependent hydrolase
MTAGARSLRDCALSGLPLDRWAGARVIDNHCHLGPHSGFFQPQSAAADLVRTMDRIGIEQACVFPTLAITTDMVAGNTMGLAAAGAFPDRLLAYISVDPHRPVGAIEAELGRCFDAGARGIKLHTGLAQYPFDGPGYHLAFAFAHEHRLPLISHGVGTPETLRRIARTYPDAHFIVAHAGASGPAPGAGPGVHAVAAAEPNVYLDLASSTGRFGAFVSSVTAAGAGKLLFGSDMPWMCPTHQIGRVLLAPIPEDDKRLILGETMAALLATRR